MAIVRLLFKKGDHRLLRNWRPVSLLNVDYKILSKIMTTRLSKIMGKIIPIEQKCGVRGRKMADIIRNLESILREMEERGGMFVALDQEKAFDRISHKYMFRLLEKMGFKGKFVKIIRAMYTSISSQISVNGALTDQINIQRSIRQGCAFSMLLFVIGAIPLIEMINDDNKIGGYTTRRGRKLKIQSYADDNTIISENPYDLDKIFEIYDMHARASESKLNAEKTEILAIGNIEIPGKYKKWQKRKIKILGTFFTNRTQDLSEINLSELDNKLNKFLGKERHRCFGKSFTN